MVSQSWVLASKSLSFLSYQMGMIMAASYIKDHRGPRQCSLSPHQLLIPSTGTSPIEEPTETMWGLEGSSLRPGLPSPALEDWEGELAPV